MNNERIFISIISQLYKYKCVLLNVKDTSFPPWKKEREKYVCNGTQSTQNVREILPNEIIIEFDEIGSNNPFEQVQENSTYWVKRISNWLIKNNYNFYITSHNGKSPHIRFQIQGLENYDFTFIKEYKSKLVKKILDEIGFISDIVKLDESLINTKNKLLSLELQPHFKSKYNEAIEEIVYIHWDED